MVDISILIPAKNEVLNVQSCLDGVFSQITNAQFEVILVDSGSVDGTLTIVENYPVRLYKIPPEDFHHARTRNYLASLAQGRYLVYLNADAFPASATWLDTLCANLSDSSVGAAYGRHLPKPDSNLERRVALASLYGERKVVKEPSLKQELGYRYYLLSTVNAAIRKDVWRATGFPSELKIFEDIGIAKRILDNGWKIVYDPSAVVYHSENLSPNELFKRYYDLGVIFKRLGIWDEPGISSSLLREGWRLLVNKLTQQNAGGGGVSRLRSLAEDSAKFFGMMFGRNEACLPVSIKRQMSAVKLVD